MKHTFVLDANILMLVLLVEEKPHKDTRDLWTAILRNCHAIVLSEPLRKQYVERWEERRENLSSQSAGINVAALVWELLTHREKAAWVDVGGYEPTSQVRHQRDWFLPMMVRTTGASFVSMDTNTRRDLRGLTIRQALRLAREKSDGQT